MPFANDTHSHTIAIPEEFGRNVEAPVENLPVCGNTPGLICLPTVEAMNPTPSPSILRPRKQLYCRKSLDWYWRKKDELEPGLLSQITAIRSNTHVFNEIEVTYGLRGWAGEIGYGRVYANLIGSLETLPKKVRYNLCHKYYWDVDMENAQPAILSQVAERYGINLTSLKNYCANRETILKTLIESGQYGDPTLEATRKKVKTEFIACFYGAKIPGLERYQADMKALFEKVWKDPQYAKLADECRKSVEAHNREVETWNATAPAPKKRKYKVLAGSFLSTFAQTHERQILEVMDMYLTTKGRSVDVLAYDGCQIRKENDEALLDTELLRDTEVFIAEQTNFKMVLAVKPMVGMIPQAELDSIWIPNPAEEQWKLVEEGGPSATVRLYTSLKNGEVMYSKALKEYYIYDNKSGLWKNNTPADINNDLVNTIKGYTLDKMKSLPKPTSDEMRESVEKVRKKLDGLQSYVNGKAKQLVQDYLPSYAMPETDPAHTMNQTKGLFPCLNGVFDMIHNRLITYKKEHYFTFKLRTAYNPGADTSVMLGAMKKWFRNNDEVIEFMQYWLGYMLTPEVNRQEFLVAWGENAGNGKSTLFDDLLRILLSASDCDPMKTYWHKFDSKSLTKQQSGNNDTVFYSMGKRACVLSEPGKPDSNLIKIITGESTVSCQAKYRAGTTFNITAKTAVCCNKMFEVEFADEGILRRILVVEMNTKFVDKAEYDRADETAKAEGRIQLRDKDFINTLKANLDGVLLYLLKGAVAYYADPNKKVPDVFFNSKMKAKSQADDITQWLRGHLVKSKGENIKLKELKAEWRTSGHTFTSYPIQKQGFNQEFIKRCESAGFKVRWNETRPEEAVLLDVKLWEEDETEA